MLATSWLLCLLILSVDSEFENSFKTLEGLVHEMEAAKPMMEGKRMNRVPLSWKQIVEDADIYSYYKEKMLFSKMSLKAIDKAGF